MRSDASYLGRPTFSSLIPDYYTDGTVMVLGGAGTIGSQLVRSLRDKSLVIPVDQDEYGLFTQFGEKQIIYVADVSQADQLRRAFIKYEPEFVFHCAAYKHVPIMERQVEQAIHNNVIGTMNVAQCCDEFMAQLIHISTDKATSPKSVMGRTKRLAEDVVRSYGFTNVRFGNVLNSRGSLLETWREQVSRGVPITLTDAKCTRYMMTVEEAVYLLLQAGTMDSGTYALEMGTPVKISDLAGQFLYHEYPNGKIELTGLREGEKLHEQLVDSWEELKPTESKGVFKVIDKYDSPHEV